MFQFGAVGFYLDLNVNEPRPNRFWEQIQDLFCCLMYRHYGKSRNSGCPYVSMLKVWITAFAGTAVSGVGR